MGSHTCVGCAALEQVYVVCGAQLVCDGAGGGAQLWSAFGETTLRSTLWVRRLQAPHFHMALSCPPPSVVPLHPCPSVAPLSVTPPPSFAPSPVPSLCFTPARCSRANYQPAANTPLHCPPASARLTPHASANTPLHCPPRHQVGARLRPLPCHRHLRPHSVPPFFAIHTSALLPCSPSTQPPPVSPFWLYRMARLLQLSATSG